MKQIIIFPAIFALLLIPCLAQKKANNEVKAEESRTFQVKDYEGWKKLSAGKFSFYVPKDFKVEKKRGTDLGYWGYKTDSINFMIYSGSRLPMRSPVEESFPTYDEKSIYINTIFANISSYEYETEFNPYKYIEIAQFYVDKQTNEDGMVIFFSSKNKAKELVEKIFYSVELIKPKSENR